MTDIYSRKKRSDIMSKISGKETKPEILVRKFLFSKGLRYRKNDKKLPGSPDIVLPKYKTAIFIHGCFWHGHHCKAGTLPETRKEFWEKKINDTKIRDKKKNKSLKEMGWETITVWLCQIKTKSKREKRLGKLLNQITN